MCHGLSENFWSLKKYGEVGNSIEICKCKSTLFWCFFLLYIETSLTKVIYLVFKVPFLCIRSFLISLRDLTARFCYVDFFFTGKYTFSGEMRNVLYFEVT